MELTFEEHWACPKRRYKIFKCHAVAFDEDFARYMGCAWHGTQMVKMVRTFQNGKLIKESRAI